MKAYTGLTKEQIEESRVMHGSNVLEEQKGETLLGRIFKELKNPLVLILLAAVVLTALLEEYVDTLIIAVAVLVNITVALFQQGKASEAYNLLRKKRTHAIVVIRDGSKQEIDAEELVVGDVAVVQAGLYIPADMEVLEANTLTANQVIFTGEAIAVEKNITQTETEHVFEQSNMLFAGTTIASGSGIARVIAVGESTEFAKIADKLGDITKEKSPIEVQSEYIAKAISVVALVAIALLVFLGVVRDLPFYELVLLAISIAVSAVPEGLPSAITAILAYGATKIGREGGLVKNLSSAQTLGSTDIIFTDKTGTLTFGDMSVSQIITLSGTSTTKEQTIERGLLATNIFYDAHSGEFVGDDVDIAIAKYFIEGGEYVQEFLEKHESVSERPFNSRDKYYVHTRRSENKEVCYIKGAFEVVWELVTHIETPHGITEKTKQQKEELEFHLNTLSEQGKRLLAVAHTVNDVYVFDGLIVMEDLLREEAIDAVYAAQEAGVGVVMITGDGPLTARSIALQSGIVTDPESRIITGSEINTYSDEELFKGIRDGALRVFSRVSPEHKLRLVEICSKRGMTVAMTGDGVNDSLALSKASIGISLSSATDVAKESADLILTNNSFATVVYALREGRRIASNITKTIIYLLSATFSIVLVIAASLIVGLPLPFLPSHILWANILEEGLMNFAFLFEPNRSVQNKPRRIMSRQTVQAITSISVFNGALFLGLYLTLFTFFDTSVEVNRTVMFAGLAISALVLSWSIRSISGPLWKVGIRNNIFFVIATLINVVLFGLTIGTETGRELLKLEILSQDLWVLLVGFGLLNIASVEITKVLFWKDKHIDNQALATG